MNYTIQSAGERRICVRHHLQLDSVNLLIRTTHGNPSQHKAHETKAANSKNERQCMNEMNKTNNMYTVCLGVSSLSLWTSCMLLLFDVDCFDLVLRELLGVGVGDLCVLSLLSLAI